MNIAVHIGFSKAASTFLQSTIFSGAHAEIGLLDRSDNDLIQSAWKPQKTGAFTDKFTVVHGKTTKRIQALLPFEFDAENERASIYSRIKHERKLTVISNEDYVGHPFSGAVLGEQFGRRIHETVPKAKILIIIREQRRMVLSHYAHFLTKSHARLDLEQFLNPVLWLQSPGFHHSAFAYSRMIGWYQRIFGADQVLALPFELLKADESQFFERICSFLEVKSFQTKPVKTKNKRNYSTYSALRVAPWINRFGRCAPANGYTGTENLKIRNSLLKLVRATISEQRKARILDEDLKYIEKKILSDIAADNKKLQKLIGFDLDSFGYAVGQTGQN